MKTKKKLECGKIRKALADAIRLTYEAQAVGRISEKNADKLAHKIAKLADDSYKVCPIAK